MVAIVGRPNVGKSTLLNRFVGRREAVVEEQPGVTRDRKEVDTVWRGRHFRVVDTGGWLAPGEAGLTGETPALAALVSQQAELAVKSADLVVLVVDVTTGVTDEDARVAGVLRTRAAGRTVVAVNKVDDTTREHDIWAFARLGLGDPEPVSALHGRASGDLLDVIVARLPEDEVDGAASGESDGDSSGEAGTDRSIFSVAIVGRPNAGKSTLFNRLVGEERSVVHDTPGTTRDSIDTIVDTDTGPIRFVDTAGMRRKAKVDEPAEYFSLVRALAAIDRADACLLVIDATVGVTHQDQRLAERVDASGCAVVVVLNKWDLLDAEAREKVRTGVPRMLGFLGYAPVLPASALSGRRVHVLLPALREAQEAYERRIPTGELNRVLRDAQALHPPPIMRGRRPRVLYATQGAAEPPTITLFANGQFPPTYLRYLERKIREGFSLGPSPIKLRVRQRNT
ncbi:MAG TPA: ribosome biogenesis GTPase Der [Acidimicrobiia bacterium]